ncbi:MAG: hypothetical protein U0790_14485 [Isosphaeraceae bacterium]
MSTGSSPPPLPNPNGYDLLVGAAESIVGEIPRNGCYEEADASELATWVEPNRKVLRHVREALELESRVPMTFLLEQLDRALRQLNALRRLARLLDAAARYAWLEGRPGEAVDRYLDLVRLGPSSSRGGLHVQQSGGCAFERIGLAGLGRIKDALDAGACRVLTAALEALDAAQEPVSEILAREHRWEFEVYGYTGGPTYYDKVAEQFKQGPSIDRAARWLAATIALDYRQLTTALAARAYELDHGSVPGSLDALVPCYLSALPLDPVSGLPLRCQVDEEGRFCIERSDRCVTGLDPCRRPELG